MLLLILKFIDSPLHLLKIQMALGLVLSKVRQYLLYLLHLLLPMLLSCTLVRVLLYDLLFPEVPTVLAVRIRGVRSFARRRDCLEQAQARWS